MMNPYRLWRLRRGARDLDFDTCWHLFHLFQRAGVDDNRELMVALTERARDSATDRGLRAASEGWRRAYAGGRRVRVAVFPVRLLEPVPHDLAQAVEEAFEGDN